jgi:hypothetical protein
MPSWLPWIFVGGVAFMILSFIASKYKSQPHKPISFAQDFVSGGLVVGLLGILVPDAFPAFPLDVASLSSSSLKQMVQGDDDIDIQVGPLRR